MTAADGPRPGAKAREAGARTGAWLVHALTATGSVIALLALFATERGEYRVALLWLLFGLSLDGIDGTLARRFDVKKRAARIDGETLDLIVDYLTYVFVPTIFIWRAGLIPEAWALPLAAMIQLSSLYLFTRRDLKTDDNYFRGFPALWNVVAFYLFVAEAGPVTGAVAVIFFSALTFAPVHVVHPFRVRDFGPMLPGLATVWAVATAALIWPGWSDAGRQAWLAVSLATAAILLLLGLWRSISGPKQKRLEETP